jgi:prophage antirepressor-like protein
MDSENVKDVEKTEKKVETVSNVQIFENQEFGKVRTILIDGEPWFVGKDVAEILGYKSSADAVRVHTDEDDKGVYELKTPGGMQKVVIINESGLYSLILSSKLESAKKFKKWVTSEVLPSLRKTGKYETPPQKEEKTGLTEWERNIKSRESMARLKEAEAEALRMRLSAAHMYMALAEKYKDNKTYEQILDSHATYELSGEYVLPLPKLEEPNYSATEVGKMLGISANKVGSIANSLNVKTKDFGQWYVSKSLHSNTEVNTFSYNQKGIQKIKEYLRDNLSV